MAKAHDESWPIEILRWGAVFALGDARDLDRRAKASNEGCGNGLGVALHACCAADWDADARRVLTQYWLDASRRIDGGALYLADLLEILDDRLIPSSPTGRGLPLIVSPDIQAWLDTVLTRDGDVYAANRDAAEISEAFRWALACMVYGAVGEPITPLIERLSSAAEDLLATYGWLSRCLAAGTGMAKRKMPPWVEGSTLALLVRSAWAGQDVYERVNDEFSARIKRGDDPVETLASLDRRVREPRVSVELPDGLGVALIDSTERADAFRDAIERRREIVLEEMTVRGWGRDPGALTIEQSRELATALRQNARWKAAIGGEEA